MKSEPIYTKLNNIEKEIENIKIMIRLESPKKKFMKSAGSWKNLDTESLKKKIYASRKVSTREKVEF